MCIQSAIRRPSLAGCILLALCAAPLEVRAVPQQPLPWKTGEVFVVDNFDLKVTRNDMGFDHFSGNMGEINHPEPGTGQQSIVTSALSTNSFGTHGGSWAFSFDFTGYPQEAFCGAFISLFGLTETLVDLTGSGAQPPGRTAFTNYFLNFDNVFGAFLPWSGRSIETVAFDTRLQAGSAPVIAKVELKDENGWDVFTRITNATTAWTTVSLPRGAFTRSTTGDVGPFRWDRVSLLSLMVEWNHVADGVYNPTNGGYLVDNIRLADADGLYPNLSAARDPAGGVLRPEYRDAFLDYLRKLSFLYFLDFASTDPRTGGITQDRGTFADLMSVGGVGFQLSAYAIGAERGYLARTSAAARVEAILTVLDSYPQGTNRVGTIGYQGFFYHFLGIDGLRKQNFDFTATGDVDESLNTVELSSIDTALAIMGVIVAKQYFQADDPVEANLRALAQRIVGRVQWPFMLATLSNGARQACLGWKPVERRDDSLGRFLLPDGQGTGFYSSKPDTNGVEVAATLDYYTDEGLIVALLGLAAPDPTNRFPRTVWDDIIRQGDGFVKTYPGALFTYQFLSCWLDTQAMGRDNHAARPTDFFENTRRAIEVTRTYAITNAPAGGNLGTNEWELSACEGPFDAYAAEGAPPAAIGEYTVVPTTVGSHLLEGEDATGAGAWAWEGNASGLKTRRFTESGGQIAWSFDVATGTTFDVSLDYSNDGPSDTLAVSVDGTELRRFTTISTGSGGFGWNNFEKAPVASGLLLAAGTHTAGVTVVDCDFYGVEVDVLRLAAQGVRRPLETGTLTPYAAACSVLHLPDEAVAALWHAAHVDLNGDGLPDVLHPRFGFADAYNVDISHAVSVAGDTNVLRTSGPWANPTGFGIDQGPMLIILDNYLGDQFVPRLFMSDTNVHRALSAIFDGTPDVYAWGEGADLSQRRLRWKGAKHAVVEKSAVLAPQDWQTDGLVGTNVQDIAVTNRPGQFLRVRQIE